MATQVQVEPLTTEEKELLAGVMEWKQAKYLLPTEAGVYVLCGGTMYIGTEDWSIIFDPGADTAEGLLQAKNLAEAWCEKASELATWTIYRNHQQGGCKRFEVACDDKNPSDPENEASWGEDEDNLSLAISRAVLAAVKGAENA